jgi:putative MATE family efflux protein
MSEALESSVSEVPIEGEAASTAPAPAPAPGEARTDAPKGAAPAPGANPLRYNALTEGAIGKALFTFALPILFGNVLQSLNGSINSIWVGRYMGGAALTATSNANTILFFLIGSVFGVGMAGTILVGQAVGAKNLDQAKRVVGTSATFFVGSAIVISVLGYLFSPQLLARMHTPADALPFAIAYMRVIFLAVPLIFAFAFTMMMLRGAGDAKTPLLFSLMSVGLDVALNPLLMFGWGPVPSFGIAGAAGATLVANAVTLVALLATLYKRNHFLCLRGKELAYLRIDGAILRSLIVKGIPMGLQMVLMSASGIAMISMVNSYGSDITAAFGASLQLWNYIQMPAMAIGMAASSMAAQNVGAGRFDRLGRIALIGVLYNFLMTGVLGAVVYLASAPALGLFLQTPASIVVGQHINAIVVWSFSLFGVSMVLSGVVRSTGAVIPPVLILFVSLWLLRIPFAIVLRDRLGVDAIWWSFPVGSFASMLMSAAYFRFGGWRSATMMGPKPGAPAPSPAR